MSSRSKTRPPNDACADCGDLVAPWASVNRGVFICDECCSIHRSLGRHISQVKSLKKGHWPPTQLKMVRQLVNGGANSIWEYTLVDPTQTKHHRKKPTPKDPLHPTKADFIRAKYQFLAFLNRSKDAESSTLEDLSQQLHSSVRTANLETSLRLLSLGADPNYFHQEKGNCALHVAAQSAQPLQTELLIVYGADPGAFDANGKTPAELAKKEGLPDLAERILECQHELTDTLSYYLCGRKPDHRAGQDFIIPEMSDASIDMSDLAKAAKRKLQALPNRLFEELAIDVFDEVDRRTNDKIWHENRPNCGTVIDEQPVAFLPVNPEFSSTRNQGRQKLARFNAREFATLIIDVLTDAKRRQQGTAIPAHQAPVKTTKPGVVLRNRGTSRSSLSDDEPLYDSVASDEDYASIGDNQSLKDDTKKEVTKTDQEDKRATYNRESSPLSIISFAESVTSSEQSDGPITLEEYLEVKKELAESRTKVQQIQQINKDLRQEINILQSEVQRLVHENQRLHSMNPLQRPQEVAMPMISPQTSPQRRPMSMIEARDQRQQAAHRSKQPKPFPVGIDNMLPSIPSVPYHPSKPSSLQPCVENNAESDYDNDESSHHGDSCSSTRSSRGSGRSSDTSHTTADSLRTPTTNIHMTYPDTNPDSNPNMVLPSQEDIVKKTEKITKKIQELLKNAQEGRHEVYSVCAEKIYCAINDMAALFPSSLKNEQMRLALDQLVTGATHLKDECTRPSSGAIIKDPKLRTQQVIQYAYEIAKAEKQLVVLFE